MHQDRLRHVARHSLRCLFDAAADLSRAETAGHRNVDVERLEEAVQRSTILLNRLRGEGELSAELVAYRHAVAHLSASAGERLQLLRGERGPVRGLAARLEHDLGVAQSVLMRFAAPATDTAST